MISQEVTNLIYDHAYVPEHLVEYVIAVSDAEPYLFHNYLCYKKDEVLIFIGYPLGVTFNEEKMEASLDAASKTMKPLTISLIAPSIATKNARIIQQHSDSYYRLDLNTLIIPPKVHNMLRRASQQASVEQRNEWTDEHKAIVDEFLVTHQVSEESERIFIRIPEYVSASKSVHILNAFDNKERLIAFDVVDYGSKDYAFYMFNFSSQKHHVPGASDLLLSEMIASARERGKKFVNLGLAINKGVTFFKQKWGGTPFLNHEFALYETPRTGIIEALLGRL
jgi:hypothetical protein